MNAGSFNLVDEPWISVEALDGSARLVGLAELFAAAASLRRIVDPSPLVTASLYRLAFAVFHRAVPLADVDAWTNAWEDMEALPRVARYLAGWRHRFDLLDEDAPFWQVKDLDEAFDLSPWTRLAPELNDYHNKVLFDHTVTGDPPPASPDTVARNLVACQVYAVGGGRSRIGHNLFDAPVARALMVVPEGETLEQTLYANAWPASEGDAAIWEQRPLTVGDLRTRQPETWRGLASRLTWPARAIKVLAEHTDPDGRIRWIRYASGLRYATADGDLDPWVPYGVTKQGRRAAKRLEPARMAWRDLHAMIQGSQDRKREAVRAVARLGGLHDTERAPPGAWTLMVAGQAARQARVDAWRQERWRVPSMVLGDPRRVWAVGQALVVTADETGLRLRKLAWRIARDLVARGERSGDVTEIRGRADALPTLTTYWAVLERDFAGFLARLERDVDAALAWWRSSVSDAVLDSARATHASLGRDAHELRAWARTGPLFDAEAQRLRGLNNQPEGAVA